MATVSLSISFFEGFPGNFAQIHPALVKDKDRISGHNSVEPKVRLQGYGYSPLCSHSSIAFVAWKRLADSTLGEAFGAPRVRLKCP